MHEFYFKSYFSYQECGFTKRTIDNKQQYETRIFYGNSFFAENDIIIGGTGDYKAPTPSIGELSTKSSDVPVVLGRSLSVRHSSPNSSCLSLFQN